MVHINTYVKKKRVTKDYINLVNIVGYIEIQINTYF
jgi:hypothetical protein